MVANLSREQVADDSLKGYCENEFDASDDDVQGVQEGKLQDEDVQGEELSKSTSQVDIIVDHQLTSSS